MGPSKSTVDGVCRRCQRARKSRQRSPWRRRAKDRSFLPPHFPTMPCKVTSNCSIRARSSETHFAKNLISSRNYLILPSELRFRSGEVFLRHLVLCIDADDSGISTDSLRSENSPVLGYRSRRSGIPLAVARQRHPMMLPQKLARHKPHECVRYWEPTTTHGERQNISPSEAWRKTQNAALQVWPRVRRWRTRRDRSADQDKHAGFDIFSICRKTRNVFRVSMSTGRYG